MRASLLLVPLLAANGCPTARPAVEIGPGADFTLGVGEMGSLGGRSPIAVRFLKVVDDGRCPTETMCAASLPVTVEVELTGREGTKREVLEIFSRDLGAPATRSCVPFGQSALWLRDVQPWPVAGKKTPVGKYRGTFSVTRSCGNPAMAQPH
jgi:hypothetical protein